MGKWSITKLNDEIDKKEKSYEFKLTVLKIQRLDRQIQLLWEKLYNLSGYCEEWVKIEKEIDFLATKRDRLELSL